MSKTSISLFLPALAVTISFLFLSKPASAQHFKDHGKYVSFIIKKQAAVNKSFFSFNDVLSNGAKPAKTEGLRKELLENIRKAQQAIDSTPAFKGDSVYRDAAVAFFRSYFTVADVDYGNITRDQKAAQTSYSKMKDLLSAEDLAYTKVEMLNTRFDTLSAKFANGKITTDDEAAIKMKTARKDNADYNTIYLIFFKSYSELQDLLKAVDTKDSKSVAQHKDSLVRYADHGLEQLDTLPPFKKYASQLKQCKKILTVYSKDIDKKTDVITAYFSQSKDFEKTKTDFEKKQTHTNTEFKEYSKSAKEYNKTITKFNKTIQSLYDIKKEKIER